MKTERRKETGTMRIKGGRKGKGGRGVGDRKEKIKTKKGEDARLCLAYCTSTVQKTKATMRTASSLGSKGKNTCDSNIEAFQGPRQ